jgi:hypothetical protein
MLVFGREFDHAAGLVEVAKRSEDFSGDPKVGSGYGQVPGIGTLAQPAGGCPYMGTDGSVI